MFVVIKIGGKQYKVVVDDLFWVEKFDVEVGSIVMFDEVLMVGSEIDIIVGVLIVEGVSVVVEVVDQGCSCKIIVFKKCWCQNFCCCNGYCQVFIIVKVIDILIGGVKLVKKVVLKKVVLKVEDVKEEVLVVEVVVDEVVLLFMVLDVKDDLKKIFGVGLVLEKKLNVLGIMIYEQIVNFFVEDIVCVDEVLNFKGCIECDNWVEWVKELVGK